jgi:hypothetical protein
MQQVQGTREGRKGRKEGRAGRILYLIDAGLFFSVGDGILVIPLGRSLVIHYWLVPVVVDLVGGIRKLQQVGNTGEVFPYPMP